MRKTILGASLQIHDDPAKKVSDESTSVRIVQPQSMTPIPAFSSTLPPTDTGVGGWLGLPGSAWRSRPKSDRGSSRMASAKHL